MSPPIGRAVAVGRPRRDRAQLLAAGVRAGAGSRALRRRQGRRLRPWRRLSAPRPRSLGGATRLGVAAATEAFDLRRRFDEIPILILGALTEAEIDVALMARAEITVWRPEFFARIAERAEALGVKPRIHVKHDSGMGRLGERDPARVLELLSRAAEDGRIELHGLWTHFATADDPDSGFFEEQLGRFSELVGEAPGPLVRPLRACGEQRRRPALGRCPFRHGPLRGRDLRTRPDARGPGDARTAPGALAALLRRRRQAVRRGRLGRLRQALVRNRGDRCRGRPDRLRRWRSPRLDQQRRGPDPRPALSACRHRLDGQHHDRPWRGLRSRARRRGRPDRFQRGGRRADRSRGARRRLETINYEITCGISARVPRVHDRSGLGR